MRFNSEGFRLERVKCCRVVYANLLACGANQRALIALYLLDLSSLKKKKDLSSDDAVHMRRVQETIAKYEVFNVETRKIACMFYRTGLGWAGIGLGKLIVEQNIKSFDEAFKSFKVVNHEHHLNRLIELWSKFINLHSKFYDQKFRHEYIKLNSKNHVDASKNQNKFFNDSCRFALSVGEYANLCLKAK